LKSLHIRFIVALLLFIVSATYGWLLRLHKVFTIPNFSYNSFVQAHSHVTFLGWGFLATISLLTYVYTPKQFKNKIYFYSYWIMVASLVGMLISFPLQGYKLYSILFLSIFLLTSYVYLWELFKALKKKDTLSSKFIRTGILYYYLSSIAIWAIAIIASKIGKNEWYHYAIYFYLHFLYNGFFVFVLFGMLVRYLENLNIALPKKHISLFYILTNIACIPAYALSLTWADMPIIIFIIGFFAALAQVISLYYLWKILKIFWQSLRIKNNTIALLSVVLIIAYFLKIILQLASAFPAIAFKAVLYKPYFVIGYIHLFTLGFMSLFLFLLYTLLAKFSWNKIGIQFFLWGIILSEFLLFSQGGILMLQEKTIPNYDNLMWMVSLLMPLGLLVMLFSQNKFYK